MGTLPSGAQVYKCALNIIKANYHRFKKVHASYKAFFASLFGMPYLY